MSTALDRVSGLVARIGGPVPRGNSILLEQPRRAVMLTKMCESMGEIVNVHVHGSAMECGAILNACKVLHLADEEVLEARKALLVRIVSMLTKMCK